MEFRRLKDDTWFIDAAPVENEEAFWSKTAQIQADNIASEIAFRAFITPFFDKILRSRGMPDGFATHCGMYRAKPVPNDGVERSEGFRFGVAENELFDCLILFESKLSITDAAFGQVVRYLQHLSPNAILYDPQSFWLIKAVVSKVVTAKWVDGGWKKLFQDFITHNMSSWVARLTGVCSSLGVTVVDGDASLGRGAYGRVFKVIGEGQEVFALKIVESGNVGRLYQEEKALTLAEHTGLTIGPVGKPSGIPGGAPLLLFPVGKPMPQPTERQEVHKSFDLLWHLHENGLVHGDPRVPNVILY
ncbi:hypothetical protein ON010_g17837 [Phytophthora cinnamomi]|nr:hypothetical protein ON010_g17837 [Phytophthora cinnamomi]